MSLSYTTPRAGYPPHPCPLTRVRGVEDAAADLPWATEALGGPPDAVNFWAGDERAVTSFHKDHYGALQCPMAGDALRRSPTREMTATTEDPRASGSGSFERTGKSPGFGSCLPLRCVLAR
jgi:jumonji domain-containing protein 7